MIASFKKTVVQVKAIKLLASKARYIMLYGGSRSGKTFIIIFAIIVRACKVKSRHVVLRQTFNSVKTSIWLDTLVKVLQIAFPKLVTHPNKSDYFLTFPNGSEVWFAGLDDDKRVEKILGKEYSTMFFNECSQISYSSVLTALTRLAEKNSLAKKAYFDENPPNKRHWSYWLFIKQLCPIETEPIEDVEEYASMIMNPKDNMDNIDENYLKMLAKMPEDQKKRFLDGEFLDSDDGEAYYSFDRELHVKETKRVHGTIFIAMDFNVNPMTALMFQFDGHMFHIHDEIWLENSDTFKMVAELKKRNYYGTVIPDSTGKNRKTSGKSDFVILKEAGYQIPVGVLNPYQVDRVNNVNRLLTANRIIINPKCKKLIGDLEKVSWKDNKLDQKGANKMLTHISDCLGYGTWNLDKITGNSAQPTSRKAR